MEYLIQGGTMSQEKKTPIDFLKVVEGIKENQTATRKEAFKQLRFFILNC
jgi:hypothetical protein